MDWFEELAGFEEADYASTHARLRFDGGQLVNERTGQRRSTGRLELPSLAELRAQAAELPLAGPTVRDSIIGDAGELHRDPEFAGALFQVASQFNVLEMAAPHVTPEMGVTGYEHDLTQGPACAIAAGAATIFRNYGVPMLDAEGHPVRGQTAQRQIDTTTELRARLAALLSAAPEELWTLRNGYTVFNPARLPAIAELLTDLDDDILDELRATLQIGLHQDVEVTLSGPGHTVSQAFCAALPLGGYAFRSPHWAPIARLVLEATYEATLLAGWLNAARARSGTVLLTRVGGGVFSNQPEWIDDAIARALQTVDDAGLRVLDVQRW